jgi:hypothetical protein
MENASDYKGNKRKFRKSEVTHTHNQFKIGFLIFSRFGLPLIER